MKVRAFKPMMIISGWFLCLFLLAACGPVTMPQQSTYLLGGVQSLKSAPAPKTHLSIMIMEPIAAPGYRTSSMIYMPSPYELKTFSRNRWVAPPAQMLQALLVQAFQKQAYFGVIVSPPSVGLTHYRLDTQLVRLEQEFMTPTSQVRLVMQASLINTAQQTVVASRRFESIVAAPGNDPHSGVIAANQAALQVSKRIAAFCAEQVEKR